LFYHCATTTDLDSEQGRLPLRIGKNGVGGEKSKKEKKFNFFKKKFKLVERKLENNPKGEIRAWANLVKRFTVVTYEFS
jgi:hypothetical protein